MLCVLLLLGVTVQPPAPSVGDLITIEFPAPVVLAPSDDFEVVAQQGTRVTVRTFAPRPFEIRGTAGGEPIEPVRVPVRSVLKPGDTMVPAPLAAPREVPRPQRTWIALAAAGAAALLAWAALFLVTRRRNVAVVPVISAEEQFRRSVLELVGRPARPLRWASLADLTRGYLARTRPGLGIELTTTEILPRLGDEKPVVEVILHQGDLEKFSRGGAEPREFDPIASRALDLAAPVAAEDPR